MKNKAQSPKPHTTHYACKEVMDKYGGEAMCCHCTKHRCNVAQSPKPWMAAVIREREELENKIITILERYEKAKDEGDPTAGGWVVQELANLKTEQEYYRCKHCTAITSWDGCFCERKRGEKM